MMIYSEFCSVPTPSVLFSTNEVLRGFDFNGLWTGLLGIHKLVHTWSCSRYGNSVLILMPLEMKMVEKLQAENMTIKVTEGCLEKVKPIDELLAYLLTRDSKLRVGTKEAFSAYLQFVQKSG